MIIAHWQLETTNNWIKMKHRILKDGNRYYPQFKMWWLFWCDMYDTTNYYCYVPIWADTVEEALEYFDTKDVPIIEK